MKPLHILAFIGFFMVAFYGLNEIDHPGKVHAQPPSSIIPVVVDPAGTCFAPIPMQYNSANGKYWGCENGTWTQVSGGGGGSGTVTSVTCPSGVITTSGNCYAISREAVFTAAAPTVTITHSLGLASPYVPLIGQIVPISGSCLVAIDPTSFAANSFSATDSSGGTDTCDFLLASATAPPQDFTPSVTVTNSNTFQTASSAASTAIYTVSVSPVGGYSATVTPSCPSAPTGITCAFSPATITGGSGSSTLTVTASYSATASNGGTSTPFTVSLTDGTLTHTVTSNPLSVATGPVQQWLMSEGSSPLSDTSGHANNLTAANTTFTGSGLFTNAPVMNGTTSTIGAANQTQTNFTNTSTFSSCVWATFTAPATASELLSTLDPANNYIGWRMLKPSATAITVSFVNTYSSNTLEQYFTGISPSFSSTPAHLCFTYDGSQTAAGIKLYLNGVQYTTTSSPIATLSATIANTKNLSVGSLNSGAGEVHSGGIADTRIFNYVLSSTQIAAIYAAGVK